MPIEISAKYRFTTLWERGINGGDRFDGWSSSFTAWKDAESDHVVTIEAKIYF
jgi:hypothetical protein